MPAADSSPSGQAALMDGTTLARSIVEATAVRAARFAELTGRPPCLATVLVGDDPASATYVKMKQNRSRKAGIASRHVTLPDTATTDEVLATITALSDDPGVDGILLQHPVPPQVDERAAFEAIAPGKDVDGVTMQSFAAMSLGGIGEGAGFASCTPGGIMRLLAAYDVPIAGAHAVVIGRSPILGKPVSMLLQRADATVTMCHSKTRDLAGLVRQADIVVAAVGRPNFVQGDWIRPGAVVIDAGYNPGNIGDVDYDTALPVAGMITPVPGGVGPMTIAILLEQTVQAAYVAHGLTG
jgi:methylenetetrahydrofolate dehydrogenase (NADP+) / methenyltetrahydrofolate cyclohydrolase